MYMFQNLKMEISYKCFFTIYKSIDKISTFFVRLAEL